MSGRRERVILTTVDMLETAERLYLCVCGGGGGGGGRGAGGGRVKDCECLWSLTVKRLLRSRDFERKALSNESLRSAWQK